MKFVWDLLSCFFFLKTVDVFIWKLDQVLYSQTSPLNFHLNCCLLCVSSTRTSMLNFTESDNILTQTLCQLSGRCKDSSTCHTASSTELRPRLHMTKWLLPEHPQPGCAFCPVSNPISPHLVLPNYLLYYSSTLLLLFFVAWNVLYPPEHHLQFKSYPPLPQTPFSPWNFPLTEVKCRLLTPRISYFVCTYLMAVKIYSFMVINRKILNCYSLVAETKL